MQTIIKKNLVLQRWDTLPQEIRDAMSSDKNAEALERIYVNLHIPPDKQKFVSLVASYVFFGFVHLEDMAKEIEAAIAINSLHARELADAITQAVFAPYRDTLEKIYTGKVTEPVRPSMDSIRPPEQKPSIASGPKPLASFAAAPTVALSAPVAAKPTSTPAPTVSPKFTASPSPLPPLGAVPAKSATSPSPAPSIQVPPTKPQPVAPAPAPFMMQSETKVSPIAQAPKFTMESLGKAVSAFGGRTGTSEAPAKIAQVEIGRDEVQKPTGVVSKYSEPAPRTIHYSNLSTPLPSGLGATSSGPVPMGSLQRTPSTPLVPMPKLAMPQSAPAAPAPSGSGGFIKTLITPKNEQPPTPLAAPQK